MGWDLSSIAQGTSGEPAAILQLLLYAMLGLVGVAAAIAFILTIIRWFISDSEADGSPSPVLHRGLQIFGVIAVMSILVFGGRGMVNSLSHYQYNPGVSVPQGSGWVPDGFSAGGGAHTLGEMFNNVSQARKEASIQARAEIAKNIAQNRIERNATINSEEFKNLSPIEKAKTLLNMDKQGVDLVRDYYGEKAKDEFGFLGNIPFFSALEALNKDFFSGDKLELLELFDNVKGKSTEKSNTAVKNWGTSVKNAVDKTVKYAQEQARSSSKGE